jgi:hypothetical protein
MIVKSCRPRILRLPSTIVACGKVQNEDCR